MNEAAVSVCKTLLNVIYVQKPTGLYQCMMTHFHRCHREAKNSLLLLFISHIRGAMPYTVDVYDCKDATNHTAKHSMERPLDFWFRGFISHIWEGR